MGIKRYMPLFALFLPIDTATLKMAGWSVSDFGSQSANQNWMSSHYQRFRVQARVWRAGSGIWGLALLALVACDRDKPIPAAETARAHFEMLHPQPKAAGDETIEAYIDYSAGMGEGMRSTAQFFDGLKNFLGGRKVTFYRVGADAEPAVIDINSPAANFVNLNNFTDRGSRLARPLERIVANPARSAVFITDFERVEDVNLHQTLPGAPAPHPIDASAWGQTMFKQWLATGNRLDVFARQYTKPDTWFDQQRKVEYQNWIYTIVFTPASVAQDSTRLRSSVLGFLLEEHARVASSTFRHFVYWREGAVVTAKNDPTIGNANANLVPPSAFVVAATKPGFEYYEFSAKDLLALQRDVTQKDKRILNGVRDKIAVPLLASSQLGIVTWDVTSALETLESVRTQAAPEVETNVETGKTVTVKNPVRAPLYEPGDTVSGIFDFVYNQETSELGIKLDSTFAGVNAPTYYRVAVVFKDAVLRDMADEGEVLSLRYGAGYTVRALGESLKLASRDIVAGMRGKEVYVFYIKLNP